MGTSRERGEMRVVWAWLSCLALVAAEKGIHNMINVGDDNVPFDSCGVTVAYTENSRLDIFVLGMDDQIWHRDQPNYTSPGDEWNPWASLGGAFKDGPVVTRGPWGTLGGVFASAPSTIVNHDGMIDVFGRGVDQRVYG